MSNNQECLLIMNAIALPRWRRVSHLGWCKLWVAGLRLFDMVRWLPRRLLRLFAHLEKGISGLRNRTFHRGLRFKVYRSSGRWWIEFGFYFLDCLGAGELYETILDVAKFNTRTLTSWEKELVREVFGDTIRLDRVCIDEKALIGPRQHHFCYVSGFTINSWGAMHNSLLIHEMVHVWQYQHLGMVYIPRSLGAQFDGKGYDYGGLTRLKEFKQRGKGLLDFNYEQQGDIVSDYYRIKNGYAPRWGKATFSDLNIYEYFIKDLYAEY